MMIEIDSCCCQVKANHLCLQISNDLLFICGQYKYNVFSIVGTCCFHGTTTVSEPWLNVRHEQCHAEKTTLSHLLCQLPWAGFCQWSLVSQGWTRENIGARTLRWLEFLLQVRLARSTCSFNLPFHTKAQDTPSKNKAQFPKLFCESNLSQAVQITTRLGCLFLCWLFKKHKHLTSG